MKNWEINTKIDELIDKSIKKWEFEGEEVDRYSLKNRILDFIAELSLEDLLKIKETKGK
jgi:hypothetical protein